MSSTLTRQFRLFPTSGNTMTTNANPLSSRLGYDLVQGVNNLHYTQPFVAYVASPKSDGTHRAIAADATLDTDELFAAQFPTLVPDGMKRFCWTLGFTLSYYDDAAPATSDFTINPVNVYLAPRLYTASTNTLDAPSVFTGTAFDVSALGGTYGLSQYTTPITFTAQPNDDTVSAYHLIDMSAGTTGAILPFDSKIGESWMNSVNVVVTFTVTGTAWLGSVRINLSSFTGWWLME